MSEANFGPEMRKLTERQQRFVINLVMQAERDYSAAYRDAGYKSDNPNSVKSAAWILAHDERIGRAIEEESRRRFKGLVPWALSLIEDVGANLQSTGAERLKAAAMVLDRAGLHAVTERINTSGDAPLLDPDRLKRIENLARGLGLPVDKLLGQRLASQIQPAPVTVSDAEYTEVSAEGIEDLLT